MSKIIQKKVGVMENLMYIIEKNNFFIVIDPSFGFNEIKNHIQKTSKEIKAILLTHGHFDHIYDLKKILEDFKCDVYLSKRDREFIEFNYDFKFIDGMPELSFEELKIKIIETPGHTPGSVCYLVENNLFTGDTLFSGCCGRVDLPGSDPEKMRLSLLKLLELDDETIIWPGHSYNKDTTTIGFERKSNIFLKAAPNKDEFLSIVL